MLARAVAGALSASQRRPGPDAYAKPATITVFFIATPGGRVIIKEVAAMNATERAVYDEFTRNETRADDGSLVAGGARLHIDRSKVDLSKTMPIDLTQVRRSDSGVFCGPKAAFLGELKHVFPDHVARGIVVPFGAYYQHYQNALVAVPDKLRSANIARPGEPLHEFVERTYKQFFEVMIPAHTSEKDLAAWIMPGLDIVQHSIRQAPLSPQLKEAIRTGLAGAGLMTGADQSVGCFVRSDTNVEDLDNFNGAGLNLTVQPQIPRRHLHWPKRCGRRLRLRSFSWR
jgi:hypothetical protein